MERIQLLSDIKFIDYGFCNASDTQSVVKPILMNQVHSADVCIIDSVPLLLPQADAFVTKTPGLNLTVKTADCAPILMVDTQAKIIAAVHAGWKGAFQGVIENTVLKMIELGGNPDHIVAGIGPHLQKASFEIDKPMRALFPVTETRFFTPIDEMHYLFDFDAYVIYRLNRAGILQVDSIQIDTCIDQSYNSYRRDPNNPARQYSFIQMR